MSLAWAEALVRVVGLYVAIGVLFAVLFSIRGVSRLDPAARGTSWGFRLVILPGAVALWPLMARRWLAVRRASVKATRPEVDE